MLRSTFLAVSIFASSTLALVYGVDSSTLVSEATYAKAKSEGFTKAIIRGYEEACGVGGQVDPNFVPSYNNARAAGITNIDTYWFPCTGSTHSCKPYATQIAEIGATFNTHSMKIGKIWIDIEKDSACNNVRFNHFVQNVLTNKTFFQWDYGSAGNLAEANKIISAIKTSGYNFGIYSSPGVYLFALSSNAH